MNIQEITEHFENANPDENYTISVEAMRRTLFNYARSYNIELRIQDHLPAQQRVKFEDFCDYILKNTTETPLFVYQTNGILRWTSNIPSTVVETDVLLISPSHICPPNLQELGVSDDQVEDVLAKLELGQVISFGEFLRSHDPNEDDLRTLNIRI